LTAKQLAIDCIAACSAGVQWIVLGAAPKLAIAGNGRAMDIQPPFKRVITCVLCDEVKPATAAGTAQVSRALIEPQSPKQCDGAGLDTISPVGVVAA
jgi:hypothetical protein